MKTFALKNQIFTAYEFDEIKENPGLIDVKSIEYPFDGRMIIEKKSGYKIVFNSGDYLTVWKDGDILPGVKAYIEEHAKIIF